MERDFNFVINSILNIQKAWCNDTQNELSHMSFPDPNAWIQKRSFKGRYVSRMGALVY